MFVIFVLKILKNMKEYTNVQLRVPNDIHFKIRSLTDSIRAMGHKTDIKTTYIELLKKVKIKIFNNQN